MDELMSAADLYIGKVGMISINEAMNKELPMIALNRLAQQEIENRAFMTERRAMIQVQNLKELPGTLSGLLEHPEQIEELKANIREDSQARREARAGRLPRADRRRLPCRASGRLSSLRSGKAPVGTEDQTDEGQCQRGA